MNIFRKLIFLGGGRGGGAGGDGIRIRKKIRSRLDPVTFCKFIVKPAYGELDIRVVVTTLVRCMCVRPSVWICLGINFYIYAWISK